MVNDRRGFEKISHSVRLAAYLSELEKIAKEKGDSSPVSWAKKWGPVAAVGGFTGLSKGIAEDTIRDVVANRLRNWNPDARSLKWLKGKLPWGLSRGLSTAGSTLLIGLAMANMSSRDKGGAAVG